MKRYLLDLLCCPKCKNSDLDLVIDKQAGEEILSGELQCKCLQKFPIINGIPRIFTEISDSQVKNRFEFQWKNWGKEESIFGRDKEQNRKYFFNTLGLDIKKDYFKGKLILDAGCGHGVFTEIMAELGAEVIGIDFGTGIDVAQWRNKNFNNVNLIQTDIMNLSFKNNIFDFVRSNGVIHHTYSTRDAFPRKNSWKECAQVIYDWYSPKYQTHHTNEDITQWFKEEGFNEIEVMDLAVSIRGKKKGK